MGVGYLIRKGAARETHRGMVCLEGDNREHMRSVLGWVEGERKGHFLDMEVHKSSTASHQVFVGYIHPLYCIRTPATNNARHYVLMIHTLASCSSRYSIHPYCTRGTVRVLSNMWHWLELPVLRTITRTQRALFVWKSVPWCEGKLGKDVSSPSPVILRND
jgi:hypothetical protein